MTRRELPAPNEWHVVLELCGWRVVVSREYPPQINKEFLAQYQANAELLCLEKLRLLKRAITQ